MNLFARILSHGFALVVVAILALGLIYRGDLFPDLELPEFLVFESSTDSDSDTASDAASGEQPVQSSMQAQEMDAGEAPVAEIGRSTQVSHSLAPHRMRTIKPVCSQRQVRQLQNRRPRRRMIKRLLQKIPMLQTAYLNRLPDKLAMR